METPALTKEKLEEYMAMLKRGEVDVNEVSAGLIAIYGATRVKGAMTPVEFLDYLGVSLDQVEMSDELRMEFKEELRQKQRKDLLKRLFARDIDYPAPEHCTACGTKLMGSSIYPFEGEIYESKYCVPCDKHVPDKKGSWSKWNPKPGDFYPQKNEDMKRIRERQLSGRWG